MMDRFNVWATMLVGRMQDLKSERGQTFAEYALILAVVVLVAVAVRLRRAMGQDLGDGHGHRQARPARATALGRREPTVRFRLPRRALL